MGKEQWLPRINPDLCTGCGDCVAACLTDALKLVRSKAALVRPEACTYCTACEDLCPSRAIELPFLICTPEFLAKSQSDHAQGESE